MGSRELCSSAQCATAGSEVGISSQEPKHLKLGRLGKLLHFLRISENTRNKSTNVVAVAAGVSVVVLLEVVVVAVVVVVVVVVVIVVVVGVGVGVGVGEDSKAGHAGK